MHGPSALGPRPEKNEGKEKGREEKKDGVRIQGTERERWSKTMMDQQRVIGT